MTEAWEYYGEPEPELAAADTKFFQIAMMAHERFSALPAYDTAVQIIPLDPSGKWPTKGFLPSRHTIPKSRESLALLAADHADDNVGIRSRRAIDAPMVVDCDEPGAVERIEAETGRKLPLTYTTLTRPQSAPHKRHIFFLQTAYSVQKILKQVTDVTHVCGYDLKGCGGWGHVRVEGCVRDGETVVALHDLDIVPIPDWLVDFLVADIARGRKHNRAMRAQKKTPEPEITSRPFVVPRLKRNLLIKSRVRSMKNLGMSDDQVLAVLTDHIARYFESPEELLSKAGIRKIRAIIRKTATLGATSYVNWLHSHPTRRNKPKSSSTLATMRELFQSCPAEITSSDARAFFSVRTHADELRLYRLFRSHGYVLHGSQGSHDRTWVCALSSSIPPSYLRKVLSISKGKPKPIQSAREDRPHHREVRVSMRN